MQSGCACWSQDGGFVPARVHGKTRFGCSAPARRAIAVRSPGGTGAVARAAAHAGHAWRAVVVRNRLGTWPRNRNGGRTHFARRRREVRNGRTGGAVGCASDRHGYARWRGIVVPRWRGHCHCSHALSRVRRLRRWGVCVGNRRVDDRRRWRRWHDFHHGRRRTHARCAAA